jgi:membrane-associated phospholipid phosphatase
MLPLMLTGIVYDSQRFFSDYIRGTIHVTEPYNFDKHFFGIHTAQGILTPNEWCQLHTLPILDVITGFMYLFFIGIYVLFSAYFVFYKSRRGTSKVSAKEIATRAPAMMWGFFWLNCLGYSTYYWYPAAPPWYVAQYGLGPADLTVRASAAGCVRFDQILGTHFFTGMYGRAADVFGAIPSLHVAYPLMAIFFCFRFGSARIGAILFYVLMCVSAVYLNHHYILDILWGSTYAVLVAFLVDRYYLRKYAVARATVSPIVPGVI